MHGHLNVKYVCVCARAWVRATKAMLEWYVLKNSTEFLSIYLETFLLLNYTRLELRAGGAAHSQLPTSTDGAIYPAQETCIFVFYSYQNNTTA